ARLTRSASLDAEDARWAVESWAEAIYGEAKPNGTTSDGTAPDSETAAAIQEPPRRHLRKHGMLVALAGGAGPPLSIVIAFYLLPALAEPDWVVLVGVLAFVGGFVGGLSGWLLSAGHSITYRAFGGSTIGRIYCSGAGALLLAMLGTAVAVPFGPAGVCVG